MNRRMNNMKFLKRYIQELNEAPALNIWIDIKTIAIFLLISIFSFQLVSTFAGVVTGVMALLGFLFLFIDIQKYKEKYNKSKK